MIADIATILQYEGIGPSPNFVTRTSDGILYAAKGAYGNAHLWLYPIAVYKSTDNGFTWTKDVEFIQSRYAGNSLYRAAIVVDGNDKVHLAWGSWKRNTWDIAYLCYATKPSGGSWSGVTDIATYTFPSYGGGANSVYSMVIDGLNQVHILYLVSQPPYYFEHHWYDGSWHKETVFGGGFNDFAMLVVDPDNTIYQLYDPGDHYAKKALGGSWTNNAIPDIIAKRFCCDKDGNLHFCNGYQYRRHKSNGEWDALEEFEPSSWPIVSYSISVSQDGVVHIVGYDLNAYPAADYQRHHQRSVAGVWSWESVCTTSYVGGGPGTSLLHAISPVYGSYYPCLLTTGYAFVFLTGWYWYRFAADPEIPSPPSIPIATTEPATELSAVSAAPNGSLVYDTGEACDCGFEYGLDITYGTVSSTQSKTTGQTFSQVIHGLTPGATYHFRAFATNSVGTGYGADRTFSTGLIISKSYALAREEL